MANTVVHLTVYVPEVPTTIHRGQPTHPKLALEDDAFRRMLPELLTEHRGRYVALYQGTVGDTEIATLNLAYKQDPSALVLVRKVTDQPEPIERLPLFRPIEEP
jgi:hypothetical protein